MEDLNLLKNLPGCLISNTPITSGNVPASLAHGDLHFDRVKSGFAIALHMHQPLVPLGGDSLNDAAVIGNLQYMMEHIGEGDNHNAPVFLDCYGRMGEMIPRLVEEGRNPRIMLDYSGSLLFGLEQMGNADVFDKLERITCDPQYTKCVEWLGSAWGHPVAPSTPVQDFRLHVIAWRHHFCRLFGEAALARVHGFSPAEMALPNHPDVCYEFVKTLKQCGYEWVLVQANTVEVPTHGGPSPFPHVPHTLVARNSHGDVETVTAIIKTQGSDSKLVGQMQPYYEAKGLFSVEMAGKLIPPLVTQIADGENGGVMMNEFPPKYLEVMALASGTDTPPMNVSEYLAHLSAIGIREEHFPKVQPIFQKRIWDRFESNGGPEPLAKVIDGLQSEGNGFHMQGGSWTSNVSWVRGYENLLGPMEAASALFAQRSATLSDDDYREALFYLLTSQTSCYRYWGNGPWVEYGRELCRRVHKRLQPS